MTAKSNRIFKSLTGTLLFLLIPSVLFSQNARKYYRAGEEFLNNKNYQDAVLQFSRAIDMEPDYDGAYLLRAVAFDSLDRYEEAAADYDRATAFQPKSADLYYEAGRLYYILGQNEQAVKRFDRTIALMKNNWRAYDLKIRILMETNSLDEALRVCQDAIDIKETSVMYFKRGMVNELLGNINQATVDYSQALKRDKNNLEILRFLASVEWESGKYDMAFQHVSQILDSRPQDKEALIIRSKIYAKEFAFSDAIDDISHCILLDPENQELFLLRAKYYYDFTQFSNAIDDYSRIILLDPDRAPVLKVRAETYEKTGNSKAAINDYKTIISLSASDSVAAELSNAARNRLYYLRRETNLPEIVFHDPKPDDEGFLNLPEGVDTILITGSVIDESEMAGITINGQVADWEIGNGQLNFSSRVNLSGSESLVISASDIYDNTRKQKFPLRFYETEAPGIFIISPYASDMNQIILDDNISEITIEGYVEDRSKITNIRVNEVIASYLPDALNPAFTASCEISNQNELIITASDIYGNTTSETFLLNRESSILSDNNPMGKTWVVFIENSDYENFLSLRGPKTDVTLMKTALARYQIHSFIHKRNLTKNQLEKFFSIELRDLIKSNQVNSLLIWYSGHGLFMNETGYWLPSDALPDEEFTYYNIHALKASLYSYVNHTSHLLIISDACNAGPGFYSAERSDLEIKRCDDQQTSGLKSSQVFTSSGNDIALDNSAFSRSFAKSLASNSDYCLPVESIVGKVTDGLRIKNNQQAVFGKVSGLLDEGGTFFFVRKE